VVGHLGPLVPGQGSSHLGRQVRRGESEGIAQCLGAVSTGQVDELDVAAGPVDQGADGGLVDPPGDQVAFRKTGDGPGGSGVAEVALRSGR
jgi:hypothetical protein